MAREAKTILTTEDKTGPGIKSAVSNLLGLDDATKKLGKTIATAFTVGAIAGTIKQLADFGAGSYKAFAEAEKAAVSFNTALAARTDVSRRAIEEFNSAFSKSFGVDGEAILGMQTMLLASGRTEGQIKKIMEAAQGLSVATGKDLKTAVEDLNKTFSGTEGRMGTLIPELKDLTDAQLKAGDGVDIVLGKFGHLNETVADLADTKLKNLNNAWGDMKETIGGNVASWASPMLDALTSIITKWNDAQKAANDYDDARAKKASGAVMSAEDQMGFIAGRQGEITKQLAGQRDKFRQGQARTGMSESDFFEIPAVKELNAEALALSKVFFRLQEMGTNTATNTYGGSAALGSNDTGSAYAPGNDPLLALIKEYADSLKGDFNLKLAPENATPAPGTYTRADFPSYGAPTHEGELGATGYNPGISSEGMGSVGVPSMGPLIEAMTPIIKVVDSLFGTLGPMITSLSSVKAILDPIGTILGAMFEVIGPLINEALAPLVGILKIVGNALGQILTPVIKGLGKVIEFIMVGILWVWNGIVTAINAALGWAGVKLKKATLESATAAGTTTTGTGGSTGGGASYAGAQAITFNFYNQGNVVGSGGLQELAATIYALIQQNARYA